MALRYAVLDEAEVSALPLDPLDEVEGARVVDGAALGQRVAAVVPTGLVGPCAYLRIDGGTTPGFLGAVLPADPLWVLPAIAAVVWSLLALGPTVGRVRRLRGAVAATSGLDGPAVPVEGDDEIADLAVAFNEAAAKLRAAAAERAQAEQALRRHVADLTHDLLIPLTVLQGHLAAMQAAGGQSPALGSAMDEAHTIGGLVQNLALAARLDSGERPLVLGRVALNPLLDRVAARHRPIAGPRGVEVGVGLPEEPLAARADLSLLEAAISNLCHNAVRYNRPGGHVALLLELAEDDPTQFEITVLDDGPGIEAALLPSLLQRGARGDSARRGEPGGQGLGLDIVQRAARLHGYTLRFDGAEGGGLRVCLRGPLDAGGA
jgi:signal transduction histidine kinase